MILEALRLAIAVLLLVVLPGTLLSYALFPRREDLAPAERFYVVLAGGVLVLMSIGIVLGFLPHGSRGALQSLPLLGLPNVELATLAACAGLGWVALRRGAFPRVAARLPTSWRSRASPPQQDPAPR